MIKGKGIAIQDSFPLIEGAYKLNILIQNSVGKEFSVFEGEVVIPEHVGGPMIVGPIIGYGFQDYPAHLHVPFKVVDKQLLVDPTSTISRVEKVAFFFSIMNVTEDLWEKGKVDVQLNGLKENDPSRKSFTLSLKEYPFHRIVGINHALGTDGLSPDYYELKLVLRDGDGTPIHEKKSNVILSPSESIAHPVTLAKSFPLSNYFLFLYSLANQYDRAGNPEKAESHYEKAFSLKPEYHPGTVEYAHFLLKTKRYQKGLEMVEHFKDAEDLRFEYFFIKGRALMGMEQYFAAIENFLEGNKIYNSDIRLLNSLGYCFYKTGDRQRALETLRASLRLSPDQKEIKNLIQEIEKE
jgi:tetratricopeptide (TPR) repeat protein